MAKERNRLRGTLFAGAVAVLGLGLLGTAGAVQANGPFNPMRAFGPGFGGHFSGYMLDHALEAVEATDEQREEIQGIMDEASEEIRSMMPDVDDRRQQFASLLAAETIDRSVFETLRQETIETGDAVSARVLEAFLDAAEVLTPEQRAEFIEQRSGFGPGFGHRFGPARN